MKYLIASNGSIINREPDSWADGRPDAVSDTYYGDDELHPSPDSLRAALKIRNAQAKNLRKSGFRWVQSDRLLDDMHFNPPRTVAFVVSGFKD